MMILVGGLACRIDFETTPSIGERAFLERFPAAPSSHADFAITISDRSAGTDACQAVEQVAGHSRLEWDGDMLRLDHPVFDARIQDGPVELRRDPRTGAIGLAHLLRVSLSVLLPARNCLPLHAAGVVIDGHGIAFIGRSGAGKTTLAGTSPWPVLSDELVVLSLTDTRWHIRQSGIWGGLRGGQVDVRDHPLAAIVALEKGMSYALRRIPVNDSAQTLAGMLLVPPERELWRRSLSLLDSLVNRAPMYRLEWSLDDPPWDRLSAALTS